MKKDRFKCGIYLPKEIYAELYRRQLPEHFSFLVACLLEEFFRKTDVNISREEMPSKAEQRAYLERKVRELFSRDGASDELPKPPVQEKPKQTELPAEPPKPSIKSPPSYVQETPKKSVPVKEEKASPPDVDLDEDILKKIESFW
jgi:hypothetical protein